MSTLHFSGSLLRVFAATLLLYYSTLARAADQPPSAPSDAELVIQPADPAPPEPAPETNTTATVLRLEELQEQQKSILKAIEQVRAEAAAAARQNAESITGRLSVIEQSLAGQRQSELEAIQKWNLLTLVVVGGFAIMGFLALLLVAPFPVRAMNRMTDAATTLRLQETSRRSLPGLSAEETLLLGGPAAESSARFLAALERMERRIHELEHTVQAPAIPAEPRANGALKPAPAASEPLPEAAAPAPVAQVREPAPHDRARLLLDKGQALAQAGRPEQALSLFEEAIGLEPDAAELHVKRGQALEKLQRPEDALASFNRAIALDKNLTTAYLAKAALLNQLARYNEALQCYELALAVPKEEANGSRA